MDPEQREDILWRDGLSMVSMAAALFHHHIFSANSLSWKKDVTLNLLAFTVY